MNIDTSSIGYNYYIAKSLFDNKNNIKQIEAEVVKLINYQIDLMASYKQDSTAMDQLQYIQSRFFTDTIRGKEQGQITPQIKINNMNKSFKTIAEFKAFVSRINFREKMSMARNFASKNDCFMYSILIEYDFQRKHNSVDAFKTKYPMLNIDYLNTSIQLIEEILGFDISETDKCYTDLNGKGEQTSINCKDNNKLYSAVQADYKANPTPSPITLCWLWHPLVYGVPYQDVIKLPAQNPVKKLSTSFTGNEKELIPGCMNKIFSQYPIFPPLSTREKNFIQNKLTETKYKVEGIYERPPWTPPSCYMTPIEPASFYVNLQKRYNKYSVSNLSGHVMMFLIMSRYFNGINPNNIILANLLFMVPYNHSIHEIFQAAKVMGINTGYSIKNNDLDNLNTFLTQNGLEAIDIHEPVKLISAPPSTTKENRKTVVQSYYPTTTGGSKKKRTKRIKKTKRINITNKKKELIEQIEEKERIELKMNRTKNE